MFQFKNKIKRRLAVRNSDINTWIPRLNVHKNQFSNYDIKIIFNTL